MGEPLENNKGTLVHHMHVTADGNQNTDRGFLELQLWW